MTLPDPMLGQIMVLDIPARENAGEDSLCYDFRERQGWLAVFDGCGGLGSQRYETIEGRTGAYIASRVAADDAMRWFDEHVAPIASAGVTEAAMRSWADGLCAHLAARMQGLMQGQPRSRIGGTMVRAFPTTLCGMVCQFGKGMPDSAAAVMWAGDSRAYALSAGGLRQLTADDLRGSYDALENLYHDAPLSNIVCADRPFSLHYRRVSLAKPQILFVATDGLFSYFPSPMDFEMFLLDTLHEVDSFASWQALLGQGIRQIASDDVAAVFTVWQFSSFDQMKKALEPRRTFMRERFVLPMDSIGIHDLDHLRRHWAWYRHAYEQWEDEPR